MYLCNSTFKKGQHHGRFSAESNTKNCWSVCVVVDEKKRKNNDVGEVFEQELEPPTVARDTMPLHLFADLAQPQNGGMGRIEELQPEGRVLLVVAELVLGDDAFAVCEGDPAETHGLWAAPGGRVSRGAPHPVLDTGDLSCEGR